MFICIPGTREDEVPGLGSFSGLSGLIKGRFESSFDPPRSRSLNSFKAFCLLRSASDGSEPGKLICIEDGPLESVNRFTCFRHKPTFTKNSNMEFATTDIAGWRTLGKKLAKLKFSAGSPLDPLLCL